jgi:hypothetical protein
MYAGSQKLLASSHAGRGACQVFVQLVRWFSYGVPLSRNTAPIFIYNGILGIFGDVEPILKKDFIIVPSITGFRIFYF